MRSRIGLGEIADLSFLSVHQTADTVLRCMAINKWAVLYGINQSTMVSHLRSGK